MDKEMKIVGVRVTLEDGSFYGRDDDGKALCFPDHGKKIYDWYEDRAATRQPLPDFTMPEGVMAVFPCQADPIDGNYYRTCSPLRVYLGVMQDLMYQGCHSFIGNEWNVTTSQILSVAQPFLEAFLSVAADGKVREIVLDYAWMGQKIVCMAEPIMDIGLRPVEIQDVRAEAKVLKAVLETDDSSESDEDDGYDAEDGEFSERYGWGLEYQFCDDTEFTEEDFAEEWGRECRSVPPITLAVREA